MTRFLSMAVALALLSGPATAATTAAADEAYQDAKSAYAKLKADASRRKFRHHWLNVAHRFDQVARKYARTDRAPEAFFTAAELYSELSRFSQNDEDLAASEAAYRKLVGSWPTHRLADDGAVSLARLLADRNGDAQGARKVLEGQLTANPKGDRIKDARALLASLPAEKEKPKVVEKPKEKEKAAIAKALEKPKAPPDALEKLSAQASQLISLARDARERPSPAKLSESEDEAVAPEQEKPEAAASDEVLEGVSVPKLALLQERLRDIRVGAPEAKVDETEARRRVKQLARDGARSELSLAEQLGLKMRRVVIDAGHGGHDTGAIGPTGVREKDVALAIALQVASRLEDAGLEVILTRDDDTFVKLEDRARIANAKRGDLFISIHCNAAPSKKMRGIETYTLNTSSDRYSIRLAARENASTERGVSDLQFILADLATKANTGESSRLAERVQRSLVSSLKTKHQGIKDLGHKEALFYVLLGAKMPAILVETSFLSHPEEEKLLGSESYQGEVARSIVDGVTGFLDERAQKLARID